MSFYNLPDVVRFKIYGGIDALGCASKGGSGNSFKVAVARGKLGELCAFMGSQGFKDIGLYHFPLGSDKPPEQLRHDSEQYGGKSCNWLCCDFEVPYVQG